MSRYEPTYASWKSDPESFWLEAARAIDWQTPPTRALDGGAVPSPRWFPDATVNTCFNAVDRHVLAGHGDRPAILYESPITESRATITYAELLEQVRRFAGALEAMGVEAGDRVLLYLPMVPQAVVAMLGCARIGAVHSVVFGGFAANELATRIDDAKPRVVVSASCGLEPGRIVEYKPLLDEALRIARHRPERVVVLQREQHEASLTPGELTWDEALAGASAAEARELPATHPLYILYTSGTTGIPKGVVRDAGGHLVALHWSMNAVYGVDAGDVYWAASDIGWVVGHSYIVYAPLFAGCSTVLFEGKPVGTPDAAAFWRVIEANRVRALFTAPTAFRAIKREDPAGRLIENFDLSSLDTLFLAGERADPDTIQWAEDKLRVPVIDHWWQTETGWPIAANCVGLGALPVKHGSPTKAVPGYDVQVVDEAGEQVAAGETGAIVLRLPLPPGCLPTLWHNDEGFKSSYLEAFPGYYQTGDAGFVDADGYVYIMSRTDDLINVAGHRLSTGGMEEVLAAHPDVAECAVVGVADALKGQIPIGLVVLNAGVERDEGEIVRELLQRVREEIGPVASFKVAAVIPRLPKTRSGKILRGTMRRIADGDSVTVPATIDDPLILDEVREVLAELGFPRA